MDGFSCKYFPRFKLSYGQKIEKRIPNFSDPFSHSSHPYDSIFYNPLHHMCVLDQSIIQIFLFYY